MKTKRFKLITILVVMMLAPSGFLHAEVIETLIKNGVKYDIYDYETAIVVGRTSACPSDLTIPSTIIYHVRDNYDVNLKVVIGEKAFAGCSSLKSVTISCPVCDSAFEGCKNLVTANCKSVPLVQGYSMIGEYEVYTMSASRLFAGCTSLKNVSLPSKLEVIDDEMFEDCTALANIKLPSSLKDIEGGAFQGCTALNSISLPSSLKIIRGYAFKGCTALKDISFSPSLQKVFDYAFYGCTAIEEITLPTSLKYIGSCAFRNCSSLQHIYSDISDAGQIDYYGNDEDENVYKEFDGIHPYSTLHIPKGARQSYAWRGIWNCIRFIREDGVKAIGHIGELSNSKAYRLQAEQARRGILYPGTSWGNLLVNRGGGYGYETDYDFKIDDTDKNQQFAIYNKDGKYYLYNIGTKQFVNGYSPQFLSGDLPNWNNLNVIRFLLSNHPGYDVTIKPSSVEGEFIFAVNDKEWINLSVSDRAGIGDIGCVGGWTEEDGGNRFEIIEVADLSEGIQAEIEKAFDNVLLQIGDLSQLSNEKCYLLKASKITDYSTAGVVYAKKDGSFDVLKGTTDYPTSGIDAVDRNDPNLQFAIYNYRGVYYLYHVGLSKFLYGGEPLLSTVPYPVQIQPGFYGLGLGYFDIGDAMWVNKENSTYEIYEAGTLSDDAVKALGTAFGTFMNIHFDDDNVKAICVANWDTDGDGGLSISEAAAVSDLGDAFKEKDNINSFDELKYFTGLTGIEAYAFKGCSLTSITLPENITTIGSQAFYGCSRLTAINIPNRVNSIAESAFYGCSNLKNVYCYAEKRPLASDNSFGYSLKSTTLHVPESVIDDYQNTAPWSYFGKIVSFGKDVVATGVLTAASGTFYKDGTQALTPTEDKQYANKWQSMANHPTLTITSNKNNMVVDSDVRLATDTYMLTVDGANKIVGYSFKAYTNAEVAYVTPLGEDRIAISTDAANPTLVQVKTDDSAVGFDVSASIEPWMYVSDFTVQLKHDPEMEEAYNQALASINDGDSFRIFTEIGGRKFYMSAVGYIVDDYLIDDIIPFTFKKVNVEGTKYPTGFDLGFNFTNPNMSGEDGTGEIENDGHIHCSNYSRDQWERQVFFLKNGKYAVRATNANSNLWGANTYWTVLSTEDELPYSGYALEPAYIWQIETENNQEKDKNIQFADANVKTICVSKWDTDSDGELSMSEVAAVTSLGNAFYRKMTITSFDELQYFKGLTSIDAYAFNECYGLTSITLPENITSINSNAFANCSSLSSIDIPNGVTSIGNKAFNQCSKMAYITIPESVTSVGDMAFNGCNALVSVALECPTVGRWFNDIKSIQNVTLGEHVTSIENGAFSNCSGLTSITIPENVTTINGYPFSGCSNLISVTINSETIASQNYSGSWSSLRNIFGDQVQEYIIGENAKAVGDYAFYECKNLISVSLPSGVKSIGNYAFSDCSSLSSITIPEGVTTIGNYAFDSCNNLEFIALPTGVTTIGKYAFFGCSGLTDITIPEGVTSIGDYALYGCSGLTTVTINCPNVGPWFKGLSALESITLGEYVTTIGDNAFNGCNGLTSITIPKSVMSIGQNAFAVCKNLKSVYVSDLAAWCHISFGDELANPLSYARGHLYLDNQEIKNLIIPKEVTAISNYAFINCSSLNSVSIPKSVTSIGEYAFRGCRNLGAIVVEDGNTVYDSRENCNAIIETATNTLISGCMNSSIPESVTNIGSFAFEFCIGLKSITIPEGVTEIGSYAFSGCWNLPSVSIPNSVTHIGIDAFSYCSYLKDVYSFATSVPATEVVSRLYGDYDRIFPDLPDDATLHVPASAITAYQEASNWQGFSKIVALTDEELTAIKDIENKQSVKGNEAGVVYDLNGRRLSNEKLPKGVYIINGKKVLVK